MELNSAFNGPAAIAGEESTTQGETVSSGGGQSISSSFAESSAAPSQVSNDSSATAHSPDVEIVDPEVQALNDAQDLRLVVEARISDVNMRARQRVEEDLARRYGSNIRQLRGEISDLQNVLDNSGPVRLTWLKLTRQISRDPHRDLNLLQSTKEMYESYQTQERQMFEERSREETEAHQTQALRNTPVQKAESQDRRTMTRNEAIERLEFLEDHRPEPAAEMHLRPGGETEEFVNGDVVVRHHAEASSLKEFVKAHDGPYHHADAASNHGLDDSFEPSF